MPSQMYSGHLWQLLQCSWLPPHVWQKIIIILIIIIIIIFFWSNMHNFTDINQVLQIWRFIRLWKLATNTNFQLKISMLGICWRVNTIIIDITYPNADVLTQGYFMLHLSVIFFSPLFYYGPC